ncbi:MAG: SDR family NAD(P)-dependent oxidoreductase [Actinobacteria bacterium]|nr:SDR family NAD(P)-dependent oxidoreductase [Actinomycetota bacterium]
MGLAVSGSNVLLTGASSGIGAAAAVAFGRAGARLVVTARRVDRLETVAAAARDAGASEVHVVPADLGDLSDAERLAEVTTDLLGGVDVLVNNAGIPKRRSVRDLAPEEVEETMRINFLAPVRLTMCLLPGMLERSRGSIVNVTSLGGRLGIRNEAAYSASKFALTGWSESMATDLWDSGVEVRIVLPGPIATEIWDQPANDDPFFHGPFEPPELVGDAIVEAVQGDRIEVYVPDLSAVVEMKTTDLDGFISGMAE